MRDREVNNINSLTQKGKINNQLLTLISNLTLEDLIAIKIELSCAHLKNRLYGLDMWKKMNYITKEALLRVSVSCTTSYSEGARFLGITLDNYRKNLDKFDVKRKK